MKNIKSGIIGFVVGDCLGVPVEFKQRFQLQNNPVCDMREKGTHFQPKGTWSDDTSMVLATMHSIIELNGYNENSFYDMADKFVKWYTESLYTPHNTTFDIGNTTRKALENFIIHRNKECGEGALSDNGNGSLMRIIPLAFYFYNAKIKIKERKNITFEVSSITHSHIISKYACLMYVEYLIALLDGEDKVHAYKTMIKNIEKFLKYEEKQDKRIVQQAYKRILNGKIDRLNINDIKSSGYVVDTLEAVLWIVLNSNDYRQAVLDAVNLGDDTDTVGALAGGLLGVIYTIRAIPTEWIDTIVKKDEILKMCELFEGIKVKQEYITWGQETLTEENIKDKYELLTQILGNHRDYHKKLNLKDVEKTKEETFKIIAELINSKILCANYNEIGILTVWDLTTEKNKKEIIDKLSIQECLALITIMQRGHYYGDYDIFYTNTKNEVLPLLINRILDVIENK